MAEREYVVVPRGVGLPWALIGAKPLPTVEELAEVVRCELDGVLTVAECECVAAAVLRRITGVTE